MSATTKYIVQCSTANMPNSCWGRYSNVALLEVDADRDSVSMISERARGLHCIVEYRGKLHEGKTERCAAGRARTELAAVASALNEAKATGKPAVAKDEGDGSYVVARRTVDGTMTWSWFDTETEAEAAK